MSIPTIVPDPTRCALCGLSAPLGTLRWEPITLSWVHPSTLDCHDAMIVALRARPPRPSLVRGA